MSALLDRESLEDEFLATVDARLEAAARRAGERLACRLGCTRCCHEVFPINALDQKRLRRGLEALRATDPERARAIEQRAAETVQAWGDDFPGDLESGVLDEDLRRIDLFIKAWNGRHPCPVLDPASGGCELYAHRPLICRLYGPPLRFAGERVPPCTLCFQGCDAKEIDAYRVEPDPESREEELLDSLGEVSETVIAHCLGKHGLGKHGLGKHGLGKRARPSRHDARFPSRASDGEA